MTAHPTLPPVPALRLLIPVGLGIIIADYFPGFDFIWGAAALGLALFLGLLFFTRSPLARYRSRSWWIAAFVFMAIAAGGLSMRLWQPRPLPIQDYNGQIVAGIVESAEYNDFSMRIGVTLAAVSGHQVPPQQVLLTVRGCDYLLHEGDVIAFTCSLFPIRTLGNPDEVDRQDMLWQRGILYEQRIDKSQFCVIGHHHTLTSIASQCRRQLIWKIYGTSLRAEPQAILLALLLGNRQFIGRNIQIQFSSAGIAHILALSGLHVGFVAYIVWLVLFPFDYLRLKKLRLLMTIIALWGFALLTGLSSSVVRATIMITFTLIALASYRKALSLNALCISALVSLSLWPASIYQAGFQLSYVTVASILLMPYFMPQFEIKNRGLARVWSLACTSFVAMLATIMLNAYYFNSISLLSVFTNVLILPVMPLFMISSIVLLLLAIVGIDSRILNELVNALWLYTDHVSKFFSHLPLAHVDGIYVTWASVAIFYLIVFFCVLWLVSHQSKHLFAALTSTVVFVAQLLLVRWQTPRQSLMVLNDFYTTPILWHNQGNGYVWTPDAMNPDKERFEVAHRKLMAHLDIDSLRWISDTLRDDREFVRPPVAMILGQTIFVAGNRESAIWIKQNAISEQIDLLVITKQYRRTITEIVSKWHCSQVILSGNIEENRLQLYINECQALKLPYHNVRQDGAWMNPKNESCRQIIWRDLISR